MDFIVPGSDRVSGRVDSNKFKDCAIRVGVVYEKFDGGNIGETTYSVMVGINGQDVPIMCKRMTRFGGVHNYEEFSHQTYEDPLGIGSNTPYATRPGDTVVIAFLDGSAKQGIILGGIRHPAREEKIEDSSKPAYISRFNGIEKTITDTGALAYTYKGKLAGSDVQLSLPPTGVPIQEAVDDPIKGGSTFGFNEDGNFNASDGGPQSITINKDIVGGGNIEIISGTTSITIAGGASSQEVTVDTLGDINLSAIKNISASGLDVSLDAKKSMSLNALKGISISSKGLELLDLLTQLIDALGTVIVISPDGPCSATNSSATWPQVLAIKAKIKTMMG